MVSNYFDLDMQGANADLDRHCGMRKSTDQAHATLV